MAIYTHRRILDCAFSVVQPGGRQHCFYGSRRAPLERTDMQVGPFRLQVNRIGARDRSKALQARSACAMASTSSKRQIGAKTIVFETTIRDPTLA
jgi:hypothetical protein